MARRPLSLSSLRAVLGKMIVNTTKPSAFLLLEVTSIGAPVHNTKSIGQHHFTSAIAAAAVLVTSCAFVMSWVEMVFGVLPRKRLASL